MNTEIINKLIDNLNIEFRELDKILLDSSKSEKTEFLNQIAHHIISSGGKRIRPLLTIASAKLFGAKEEVMGRVIFLAAAIEFIHTATLLHDDVVDDSSIRRNNKTANYIWGNKPSILVGDFLFSQSFKQMIKTDNLKVLSILADISAKIAEAEVWQLYLIGKIDLKFKDYISLLEAKTANLFAASCECSAIIANATKEQSDALKIFGLNLGVIFQINDDISDYFASNKALGKKRGSDFFENKVTLPLILLLQESTAGDLMQIKSILRMQDKGEAELLKIMEYFGKYSIEKKSYRALETFISDGVKGIEFMPTSQFKNLFIDLIKNYKK